MTRAIVLAERGWGRVHPNPMVGAVLLKNGEAIAEGWHAEFGSPHAEANALAAAGDLARGSTCVVTLEPCAHHGKTPPCTDALLAAGVARVVCAVREPGNEAGGGLAKLKAAGVSIESGLMAEDAARMNAAFLCAAMTADRPWVAVKVATSSDGFLATPDRKPRWISSYEARDWVQWLRAGFDAVAVGRVTVETDNPQLTVRGPLMARVMPTRVIFSRKGMVKRDQLVFTSDVAPTTLLTDADGEDTVAKLRTLRSRGVQSLLVEGGAALIQSLLADDLVDRIYWVRARKSLGQGVSAFGDFLPDQAEAQGWKVVRRQALGPDTLIVTDRRLCLPAS